MGLFASLFASQLLFQLSTLSSLYCIYRLVNKSAPPSWICKLLSGDLGTRLGTCSESSILLITVFYITIYTVITYYIYCYYRLYMLLLTSGDVSTLYYYRLLRIFPLYTIILPYTIIRKVRVYICICICISIMYILYIFIVYTVYTVYCICICTCICICICNNKLQFTTSKYC